MKCFANTFVSDVVYLAVFGFDSSSDFIL